MKPFLVRGVRDFDLDGGAVPLAHSVEHLEFVVFDGFVELVSEVNGAERTKKVRGFEL